LCVEAFKISKRVCIARRALSCNHKGTARRERVSSVVKKGKSKANLADL